MTGASAKKMVTKTMGNTFWSNDWIKGDASTMGFKNVNFSDNASSDVNSKKDDVGKIQKMINVLCP